MRGMLDTLHHRFARLPWFESEHARALRAYLRRAVGLRFRCVQPVTDAPGAHRGWVPKPPVRALPLPTELTKEVNLPRMMEFAHGVETQFNKSLGEIGELRESMAHLSGSWRDCARATSLTYPAGRPHLPGQAPPLRQRAAHTASQPWRGPPSAACSRWPCSPLRPSPRPLPPSAMWPWCRSPAVPAPGPRSSGPLPRPFPKGSMPTTR